MSEYPNSGAVWKNDNRLTDSHPHFKGSAEVDGKHYWVSVWFSSAEGGRPPLKFKFTEKDVHAAPVPVGDEMEVLAKLAEAQPEPKKEYVPGEDMNDDIPF